MTRTSKKRRVSCVLVVAAGLATLILGMQYPLGTLSAMGPGYFPVMLGVLLTLLGVLVGMVPEEGDDDDDEAGSFDFRGPAYVVGALALFIGIGSYFGLGPASLVLIFVAAFADRTHSLRSATVLAAVMTAAGLFLFAKILQGQLPIFIWN